ncbi:XTP/dITP diphosphatase [Thermodesulfobacteriota bacterium]
MVERTLVLATRNKGKISELTELLSGFDINVKNLNDFGPIPPVVEDGKTFEDNAYKKASFTAKVLGLPAIADDSGLVVEALDGAPGVYSARYAGENTADEDNNRKLLSEMKGISKRNAYFETAIIIAVPMGHALTYIGRVEGEISEVPVGENGFGYDPLFYYPPLEKTFARMTQDEKNSVSHRGKAVKELQSEFEKVIIWLENRLAEEP